MEASGKGNSFIEKLCENLIRNLDIRRWEEDFGCTPCEYNVIGCWVEMVLGFTNRCVDNLSDDTSPIKYMCIEHEGFTYKYGYIPMENYRKTPYDDIPKFPFDTEKKERYHMYTLFPSICFRVNVPKKEELFVNSTWKIQLYYKFMGIIFEFLEIIKKQYHFLYYKRDKTKDVVKEGKEEEEEDRIKGLTDYSSLDVNDLHNIIGGKYPFLYRMRYTRMVISEENCIIFNFCFQIPDTWEGFMFLSKLREEKKEKITK
jgi:hypothetical protein